MTVLMLILLGCAIVLVLGLSAFAHYEEHQQALAKRAAKAEAGIDASKARSALLQRVLPTLLAARETLHSEVVELVGTRAEFAHTLAAARACKEGTTQGAGDQRTFESTQYKHAINLSRLQNQLATEIDRAALRPLRIEAQRTRLRVEANERVVESILTQQAIDEARGRKRGAPQGNKIGALRAELGALVEQYKADGKESAGLELALEALPDDPAEGEK